MWQIAIPLLALTTMATIVAWYRTPALRPAVVRFQVMPPGNLQLSSGAVGRAAAAVPVISPDDRTMAFTTMDRSGKRQLWVQPIDSLSRRQADEDRGGGRPPLTICALAPNVSARGGAWNREGVIVFSNG